MSMSAELAAVIAANPANIRKTRPLPRFATLRARYLNRPVRVSTATMSIMPMRRPRVLKSTNPTASSWDSDSPGRSRTARAPARAIVVR